MKIQLFFFFLLINSFTSTAQPPNQSELKITEIMKGKDFIGYWPENHYWHISGEKIIFQWNPNNELDYSYYNYDLKTKKITPIDEKDQHASIPYDSDQSNFNNQYYLLNGNLWMYHKKEKKCDELISGTNRISRIHRLSNPNEIVYQQGDDLYLYNHQKGTIHQLTHFKKGFENTTKKKEDVLIRQQEDLFQFIQEEKELEAYLDSKKVKYKEIEPFYLGTSSLDFIQISNDGKTIYFSIADYPENTSTQVEHHVTETGYSKTKPARPKVGASEPIHHFYLRNIEMDSLIEINFDSLPEIRKKPSFLQDYGYESTEYEVNRKIVFHTPISSNSGRTVMDIRSYDNKDRWIIEIKNDGTFDLIDHQHDEAWIGGPGISSWNRSSGNLGFWNNDESLYFQSEKTGYSHLYTFNFKNRKTDQLTSGTFEIQDVTLSKDKNTFYLKSNKSHPGNQGFYHFIPKNKAWTPLLTDNGAYDVLLSIDEKSMAVLYSDKISPWELFIGKVEENAKIQQLTYSESDSYKKYPWRDPQVVTFLGKDGTKVNARLYEPSVEKKNSAAVIFVHGAGYLQNAHNYWSNYYREYMFHNLLTDNGYTVLDIDFRASAGYGRDFRTAIYRHMGGWDLEDNLSGKNLLVDSLGIDPNRVGIYGGSYGGFITLMALLTKPEEFACGAALRSVTDWMHYNHEYTSNILNYPFNDSVAYYRSSPINFAQNLNKPLLMLHGMVDDNVQFQDVVRLSQRFIELGKKDWDLAVFPVEAHGFVKPYSWADEYRRIFELFQANLLQK